MRRYLSFAAVVVRFGATGALLITPQSSGWANRLFFDPHQDDQYCSDSNPKNHVLGFSSIFVASLVEELTRTCDDWGKQPLIHDMSGSVARAIPRALVRCQLLHERGYGDAARPPFEGLQQEAFKELFVKPISKRDEVPFIDPDDMPPISQIEVPELSMPDWSILSQTVQLRIGHLARAIVIWGVDAALNRHVPRENHLIRVLSEEAVKGFDRFTESNFEEFLRCKYPEAGAKKAENERLEQKLKSALVQEIEGLREKALSRTVKLPPDFRAQCLAKVVSDRKRNEIAGPWKEIATSLWAKAWETPDELEWESIESFTFTEDVVPEIIRNSKTSLLAPSDLLREPNHSLFAAPVLRYGKRFTIVDRAELEGIRAVHKLIKDYLAKVKNNPRKKNPPLSIAAFGPPGSGKTTAVKNIVSSLAKDGEDTKMLVYNLAELTSSDQLASKFHEVSQTISDNKVAVAFFDEFDAQHGDEQWGWLKFFLAPMEDMEFRGEHVHNSIFVFAGGTSPTYDHFALVGRGSTDTQVQEFARAKGPDFVSRLSGYLNVVGVNPSSPSDRLYLIRRAIVIRHFLEDIQNLDEKKEKQADIDPDMLRAILFVPNYVNNTRSVRKMLEQCSQTHNRRIAKSSVPLLQQLAMLTDGKAFMDLLADVASESND